MRKVLYFTVYGNVLSDCIGQERLTHIAKGKRKDFVQQPYMNIIKDGNVGFTWKEVANNVGKYFILFVFYHISVQVECVCVCAGVCLCNALISGLKLWYCYCMFLWYNIRKWQTHCKTKIIPLFLLKINRRVGDGHIGNCSHSLMKNCRSIKTLH